MLAQQRKTCELAREVPQPHKPARQFSLDASLSTEKSIAIRHFDNSKTSGISRCDYDCRGTRDPRVRKPPRAALFPTRLFQNDFKIC